MAAPLAPDLKNYSAPFFPPSKTKTTGSSARFPLVFFLLVRSLWGSEKRSGLVRDQLRWRRAALITYST